MFHTQITGNSIRTNVVTRFNFTFKMNNILITFGKLLVISIKLPVISTKLPIISTKLPKSSCKRLPNNAFA